MCPVIVSNDTEPATATAVALLLPLLARAPAPPAASAQMSPALSAVTEKRRSTVSTTRFCSGPPRRIRSESCTNASTVESIWLSLSAPANATAVLLLLEPEPVPELAVVAARPPVAATMRFWLLALTSIASAPPVRGPAGVSRWTTIASEIEACVRSVTMLTEAAAAMPTPVLASSCCWVLFGSGFSASVLTTVPATVKV